MILRAKTILPVTAPPIEDGAVFIDGNKIRAVLPWQDLRPHLCEKALDLGEVILLPGLVNAHCHLDYTDMAGELAPVPRPLVARSRLLPALVFRLMAQQSSKPLGSRTKLMF